MDKMDELFKTILTNNNIYYNDITFWFEGRCKENIHCGINCEFEEWFINGYRDFSDWYSTHIYDEEKIEIDSEMVRLTMQYEKENYGEIFLNDKIDDASAFNKHIIYILIIKYIEDDEYIYNKRFKSAMRDLFNSDKEEVDNSEDEDYSEDELIIISESEDENDN